MIDIYAKDCTCPICSSEMVKVEVPMGRYLKCLSDCYEFHVDRPQVGDYGLDSFWIFDDYCRVSTTTSQENKDSQIEHIKTLINYWKENERYLIKMITGEIDA